MAELGLDIGSTSIKLIKLNGKKVEKIYAVANPVGKVLIDLDAEAVKVAEAIKVMLNTNKVTDTKFNVVVPDGLVYSRVIQLPILSDAELGSAIKWEAEQYVPVPLEEVELTWEVVDRPGRKTGEEKMGVYLVAASKKLINALVNVFTKAGIEPDRIEPELVPVSRAVIFGKQLSGGVMLCHMGASGVSLGVFLNEKLLFVYRFGSGGVTLTKVISSSLQLPMNQAEEYKRSYGARADLLEGKLLSAMVPVLNGLTTEIKRAVSYYTQQYPQERLNKIIITGGVALMPGLVEWMTKQLGVEVSVGDPFVGYQVDPNFGKLGSVYAPALGAVIE